MTALEFYLPNRLEVQNLVLLNDRWGDDEVVEEPTGLRVWHDHHSTFYADALYHIEKGMGKYTIKRRV